MLSTSYGDPDLKVTSDEPIYINYQEIPPNTWYPLYGDLRAAIWSPSPGQIEGRLALIYLAEKTF